MPTASANTNQGISVHCGCDVTFCRLPSLLFLAAHSSERSSSTGHKHCLLIAGFQRLEQGIASASSGLDQDHENSLSALFVVGVHCFNPIVRSIADQHPS